MTGFWLISCSVVWLLIIGLLLLIGWHVSMAGTLAAFLFLMFGIAITINLYRKRVNIDCGCFGSDHAKRINVKMVVRDAVLFLISILIVFKGGGFLAVGQQSDSRQAWFLNQIIINTLTPLAFCVTDMYIIHKIFKRLVIFL